MTPEQIAAVRMALGALQKLGDASDKDVSHRKWTEAKGWEAIEALEGLLSGALMVQPAQQAAEPVAKYIGECSDGSLVQLYDDVEKGTEFYTHPAPTQQPLTDEQIGEIGRNHEKFDKDGNEWFDRWTFARAILKAAQGITGGAK